MRRTTAAAACILAAATALPLAGGAQAFETKTLVFNGEANRLNVYDAAEPTRKRTVIFSAADPAAPDDRENKDINAQICFHEVGGRRYFIAGEDTGQNGADGDPGWGWFELKGSSFDDLHTVQRGKLVPDSYSNTVDNPENYGCGFLPNGNLLTTDVGDQQPQSPANGQLILWFHDGDGTFDDGFTYGEGAIADPSDTDYCKIDTGIATAGGIWVDGDTVYVASARPGNAEGYGIFKYTGLAGVTKDDCPDRNTPILTQPALVTSLPGPLTKSLFIPGNPMSMTPSAIVPSGRDTWYVSSVFDGNVAEYSAEGVFMRHVAGSPSGAPVSLPIGQFEGDAPAELTAAGTPFGIGVTPDGTLWYADMGVRFDAGPGPAEDAGSVKYVTFAEDGTPSAPQTPDEKLNFPDGIGVVTMKVND
jgi:hypothetical protein